MAIARGTRFGPHEIVDSLGSGGMGDVYRARDTQLQRDVAIKVLSKSFVNDANRVARLQREAEVLASLNHSNIAHIYGLERGEGTTALVMELVEGPTLAVRIAQGALPADEALNVAIANRRGAGGCARTGNRAPRLEALQREAQARRHSEGARLRDREGAGPPGDERLAGAGLDDPGDDGSWSRARDGRLHEPRAGARQSRRRARRHLGVRLRALRNVGRAAGVRRRGCDHDPRARARARLRT